MKAISVCKMAYSEYTVCVYKALPLTIRCAEPGVTEVTSSTGELFVTFPIYTASTEPA